MEKYTKDKREDINIRIENSLKKEFKILCININSTMSDRIRTLIEQDVNNYNK